MKKKQQVRRFSSLNIKTSVSEKLEDKKNCSKKTEQRN